MKLGEEILYLTRDDVKAVGLSMQACIDLMERAFIAKGHGLVQVPIKSEVKSRTAGFMHAMPCYAGAEFDVCGIKWLGGYLENPKTGIPYISALIILNDADTGLPVAIMDGSEITGIRTAAVSGLAYRHLLRSHPRTASIIGCGLQGRTHLEALLAEVPGISEVIVWGPNESTVDNYCSDMKKRFDVELNKATSIQNAVTDIDVVTITGPGIYDDSLRIIDKSWLSPGTTIVTINGDAHFKHGMLEAVNKIYYDDLPMFDSLTAEGMYPGCKRPFELGDLLVGNVSGREDEDEIIVSMPGGIGLDDIVAANRVLEMAISKGLGSVLSV